MQPTEQPTEQLPDLVPLQIFLLDLLDFLKSGDRQLLLKLIFLSHCCVNYNQFSVLFELMSFPLIACGCCAVKCIILSQSYLLASLVHLSVVQLGVVQLSVVQLGAI